MCTYTHIYTHIYHGGSRARELPFISRVVKFVSILMGFGRLTCHVYFFVIFFYFEGCQVREHSDIGLGRLTCHVYIYVHAYISYTRMCLICVYVHIYTYVSHMRVYTHIHVCVSHACIYTYVSHMRVYTQKCIHFICIHMACHTCMCLYVCIHTYMHTSLLASSFSLNTSVSKEKMCVCVCVYTHIHTYKPPHQLIFTQRECL